MQVVLLYQPNKANQYGKCGEAVVRQNQNKDEGELNITPLSKPILVKTEDRPK